MLREKLNKIFSTRVFYIVFSLIVAAALWMYVEIAENREMGFPVQGVRVEFRNEDVLRDRGLFLTSHEPQTVNLTFDCPRSVAQRLFQGPLTVEVDLATITTTGILSRSYEIIYPPGVTSNLISDITRNVGLITLRVDKLSSRPVQVRVDYRGGTASEELVAEAAQFAPQMITVFGPEEVVSGISYARVPILRENLSMTYSDELAFVLFDENDEPLQDDLVSSLEFSHTSINVTVPIREIKDVTLSVEPLFGAGATELNTRVTIEPPIIKISGEPDALREFNNILLGSIEMTRFTFQTTQAFPIIIPNHLTNLSGETEARVLVEVLGLEIDFYVTENLQTINTPPGHWEEILTQSLDVRIRGTRENLDRISLTNIRVVADLRDVRPGTSLVTARVYVDGTDADVGAVGGSEYRLTVRLRETS